jgi:hypothetical protein
VLEPCLWFFLRCISPPQFEPLLLLVEPCQSHKQVEMSIRDVAYQSCDDCFALSSVASKSARAASVAGPSSNSNDRRLIARRAASGPWVIALCIEWPLRFIAALVSAASGKVCVEKSPKNSKEQ